jgi:hypothetical protein
LKSGLLSTKQKCYPNDHAVLQEILLLNPVFSLGPVRYEKRCCTSKLSRFLVLFITCHMASNKCTKSLTPQGIRSVFFFCKHFLVFCCNYLRKHIFLSRSFPTSHVGKHNFLKLRVILEKLQSIFIISFSPLLLTIQVCLANSKHHELSAPLLTTSCVARLRDNSR